MKIVYLIIFILLLVGDIIAANMEFYGKNVLFVKFLGKTILVKRFINPIIFYGQMSLVSSVFLGLALFALLALGKLVFQ